MRKRANISPYMRRPLVKYDLNFLIWEENLIFFFISVPSAPLLLLLSFSYVVCCSHVPSFIPDPEWKKIQGQDPDPESIRDEHPGDLMFENLV